MREYYFFVWHHLTSALIVHKVREKSAKASLRLKDTIVERDARSHYPFLHIEVSDNVSIAGDKLSCYGQESNQRPHE